LGQREARFRAQPIGAPELHPLSPASSAWSQALLHEGLKGLAAVSPCAENTRIHASKQVQFSLKTPFSPDGENGAFFEIPTRDRPFHAFVKQLIP
jgi:hypothetical protein